MPPEALAIRLNIGMAYGFPVFWLPMTHRVTNPDLATCQNLSFLQELFITTRNWTVPAVNHIFETLIAILAGLLLVGMICNFLVKSVKEGHAMAEAELEHERSLQHEAPHVVAGAQGAAHGSFGVVGLVAGRWLAFRS